MPLLLIFFLIQRNQITNAKRVTLELDSLQRKGQIRVCAIRDEDT